MTFADASIDDLIVDPHPTLAAARAAGPVQWLPALGAWVVTTRRAAVAVMRDAERFTVDDPRFSTGQILGPSMLSTDGEAHRHHRGAFTDWFADRNALVATTAEMTTEAQRLVAACRADGAAELRTAVAGPLAAGTVTRMLGLDPPGPATLLTWYRRIVDAVQTISAGADPGPDGHQAYAALRSATLDAADAGRAAVLTDARSHLADDEVAANAAVIAFGGIETSEAATANAFWHLLTNPELHRAVAGDRSLVPAFVDESFRLEPASATVDRYATADVELDGARITAGDPVIVSLAGANRDPAVFPDPDTFRLDRTNGRQHTTFALGPHACLGIHIARAQTIAAVDAVLGALPDAALDPGQDGPRGLVFRKPPTVHVHWTAP